MIRFWNEWLSLTLPKLIDRSILSIQARNRDLFFMLNDQSMLVVALHPQKPLIYHLSQSSRQKLPLYNRFDDILASAVITDLELKEDDQIIRLDLVKKSIFGEIHHYQAIIEMIPRFVNMVIIDENRIKAAFAYFNQIRNPRRPITMHQPYRYPDPPSLLRDPAYLVPLSSTSRPPEPEALNKIIQQAHHLIDTQNRINPRVQYRQILQAAIHKHQKLMENLKQDIENSRDADRYRLYGQLLQSNFQAIPLQQDSITLTNFYSSDRESITIPLNPNHQPSDQIEHYFRKYKKMKKAAELQSQRIKLIRHELEGYTRDLERIDQLSPTDLEQRIKKLRQRINLSPQSGSELSESQCYHEYRLPSGKPLLVGKSSAHNDQLTFKVARPFDYWFHARDFKGSHVIVRLENKTGTLSRRDIELAAGIAAYYSKARHSTLVPVDYTLRRYLRKPQNAAPGFVIFQREKTVMVHPLSPQELIDQLTQEVTP